MGHLGALVDALLVDRVAGGLGRSGGGRGGLVLGGRGLEEGRHLWYVCVVLVVCGCVGLLL